jgi:hypothetical protein
MEMQVVHYGRSKGDIAKQVILSFLFKKVPGVYNKFIDKLDFFNLPNPLDNYKDLNQDFYIPSVFYTTEDDDVNTMPNFSFYSYQGSLTKPPCTERTTYYIAAEPIPLSTTIIELFKEALKEPNLVDNSGNIVKESPEEVENNRGIQSINKRKVFLFDHAKYGLFDSPHKRKKSRQNNPTGHYEKATRFANEYLYIFGNRPSGLPGAMVVTEKEVRGE